MNEKYIEQAIKTESKVSPVDGHTFTSTERLNHAIMGMVTELGELMDVHKRHQFYGKDIDLNHVQEEIGDFCWYLALALDVKGFHKLYYQKCDEPFQPQKSELLALVFNRVATFIIAESSDGFAPYVSFNVDVNVHLKGIYVAIRQYNDAWGFNWEEILDKNIAKLATRYEGQKFSAEAATQRDLPHEQQAMNDGDIRHHSGNKYIRTIHSCVEGHPSTLVDVYAVLEAFSVTNPGSQHALKKLLCSGIRGAVQDMKEAMDAIKRAIQIEVQK